MTREVREQRVTRAEVTMSAYRDGMHLKMRRGWGLVTDQSRVDIPAGGQEGAGIAEWMGQGQDRLVAVGVVGEPAEEPSQRAHGL